MATDKYLNLQGLAEVADYVNQKLRIVTSMPSITDVELHDVVYYKGATEGDFIQGCIYMSDVVKTYYAWGDITGHYHTDSPTPEVGDPTYSDGTGTLSPYTVEAYDDVNDTITVNSTVYNRSSDDDVNIIGWVLQDTSVILNGSDKTGDEANFYAPTASGNEGQVLVSKGANASPEWASLNPNGYSPSFLDDSLVFTYGVLPEVEGNTLIFDLDD